jgi:hypothetical protein
MAGGGGNTGMQGGIQPYSGAFGPIGNMQPPAQQMPQGTIPQASSGAMRMQAPPSLAYQGQTASPYSSGPVRMQAPPSLAYGGQQPTAPPIQNPPYGGISGNPGYSTGAQPQLSGNYWNQIAQSLAGPSYLAKAPPSNPNGTVNSQGGTTTGAPGMSGTLPYYYANLPGYGL